MSETAWGGSPIGSLSQESLDAVAMIERHLRELVEEEGIVHVSSAELAEEFGEVTASEAGLYLSEISSRDAGLVVSKCNQSPPYRWRVSEVGV